MRKSPAQMYLQAAFDESGNFIIYTSMVGVKVVNIHTNKLVRVLGKVEQTERFLGLALFQGKPMKKQTETVQAIMDNDSAKEQADPMVVVTAYKKNRFFLFTTREPPESSADLGRDIFN